MKKHPRRPDQAPDIPAFEDPVTLHGRRRLRQRGLSEEAVAAALAYGRCTTVHGAGHFAIGRSEVEYWRRAEGVDLSRYLNVHIIFEPWAGVITGYRSDDFHAYREHGKPRRTRHLYGFRRGPNPAPEGEVLKRSA